MGYFISTCKNTVTFCLYLMVLPQGLSVGHCEQADAHLWNNIYKQILASWTSQQFNIISASRSLLVWSTG